MADNEGDRALAKGLLARGDVEAIAKALRDAYERGRASKK